MVWGQWYDNSYDNSIERIYRADILVVGARRFVHVCDNIVYEMYDVGAILYQTCLSYDIDDDIHMDDDTGGNFSWFVICDVSFP